MSEVLDTARWVAEGSRDAEVDSEALRAFCTRLRDEDLQTPVWDWRYHFRGSDEDTAAYTLVLDTLNFCFWPAKGAKRWEIRYGNESLSGYVALAASLKIAILSRVPITDAEYLARLSMEELDRILSGAGELQLMERRLESVRELGDLLLREYQGKAHKLVEAAENSALALARIVAGKLTSFRDEAFYKGRKVFFYKRAQILAADLHGAFSGEGWGRFHDPDELTAFADYKLPQVLRHLGILRYSSELARKVDNQILIESGSSEEVEIRANTIWAVELIRRELERLGKPLRAFEIDWLLWNLGQRDRFRERPYHRTVSVFY